MGQYISTHTSWPDELNDDHVRRLRHHMRVVTTLTGLRVYDGKGAYVEYARLNASVHPANNAKNAGNIYKRM